MGTDVNHGEHAVSPPHGAPAEKLSDGIRVEREQNVIPPQPSPRERLGLSFFDLQFLMSKYAQYGLVFGMPAHDIASAVARLENSLSEVLKTFYPLAGRLVTSPSDGSIYIDSNDAGVSFFEASADISVASITAPDGTPVDHLFPLNDAVGTDHQVPILAVQVTKLRDGIFVACSSSHTVCDGVTAWQFWSSWSEICREKVQKPSITPSYDRSTATSHPNWSIIRESLDFNVSDISSFRPPPLRCRFFHFTTEMLDALKDRANRGRKSSRPVSTSQALCGHVWQAITRARGLGPQDITTFQFSVDCRARLSPPLSPFYFGNCVQRWTVTSQALEMANNDVSFSAQLLHDMIQGLSATHVTERISEWDKKPILPSWKKVANTHNNVVHLGNSPRFKVYDTDFGWGKPLAARSGGTNKIDGKLLAYPGREQEGSIDLEICLVPPTMNALENDQLFVNPLVSPQGK